MKKQACSIPPLMAEMCPTCPFREGSPYEGLRTELTISALSDASRICHSTGSNGIHKRTGKPPKLCRGARTVQLNYFAATGFISAPTDAAFAAKWKEMQDENRRLG